MPLTSKGESILANFRREYGAEQGERYFYASKNAGKITGVDAVDMDDPDIAEQSKSAGFGSAGIAADVTPLAPIMPIAQPPSSYTVVGSSAAGSVSPLGSVLVGTLGDIQRANDAFYRRKR